MNFDWNVPTHSRMCTMPVRIERPKRPAPVARPMVCMRGDASVHAVARVFQSHTLTQNTNIHEER